MKCQCENALCVHHKGAFAESKKTKDYSHLAKSLKGCDNQATHTVYTRRGKFKLCNMCAESAQSFATHIYKGV